MGEVDGIRRLPIVIGMFEAQAIAIEIEKIFLIETYISCPYCQTQNTFAPSTQARNLQNIARGLAEQRTAHLYEEFERESKKEQECPNPSYRFIHF